MRCIIDKMFDKFLQLSSRLPYSARAWPIQLRSAYFTALSNELVDQMLTRIFKMQSFVDLNMKSKQLAALQEVRDSAYTEYKSLEEE